MRFLIVSYSYFSVFNHLIDYYESILPVSLIRKVFPSADGYVVVLLNGLVGDVKTSLKDSKLELHSSQEVMTTHTIHLIRSTR